MVRTTVTASLLAAAALAPAAAHAAGGPVEHARLCGQPTMIRIDAHRARLELASDRLPRTASGAVDAGIRFAGGRRVSALKVAGRHGGDTRYTATVTSRTALRTAAKYTVRPRRVGVRLVKLHPAK
jgi:hypothetical protein